MQLSDIVALVKMVVELLAMVGSGNRDEEAEMRHLFSVVRQANDLYARARFGA
jgi:hypothetical protein